MGFKEGGEGWPATPHEAVCLQEHGYTSVGALLTLEVGAVPMPCHCITQPSVVDY